jgi:predicted nucleic acid-binding protein
LGVILCALNEIKKRCILGAGIIKLIKNRIYLDNCCFNRPYDDQSNLNVHLETEAKIFIQNEILNKNFELAWSFMMDYEISSNPFPDRQIAFLNWKTIAAVDIDPEEEILDKGRELSGRNIKKKDALHIVCAVKAECEYFLTTDGKILNKSIPEIKIINPLDFIRQLYTGDVL